HQLHDRLPPSGGRSRGGAVVRIATATDQGRIAEPPRSLVQCASSRSGSGNVAVSIKRDRTHRVMGNFGREQGFFLLGGPGLKFAQPFYLTRHDQVFVLAKRNAVLSRKSLRALSNKIHMRAVAEDLARGANRIGDTLHAAHASRAQRGPVHDESIELYFAVAIKEAAVPGIEDFVILHDDD